MGGCGSGQRYFSKQLVSDYIQLDIRHWQRNGVFEEIRSVVSDWWIIEVAPPPWRRVQPNLVIVSRIGREAYKIQIRLE